jgi:hypothetical protein
MNAQLEELAVALWQEYERLKREYVRNNPEATPEQYQQAMTALAQRLGL